MCLLIKPFQIHDKDQEVELYWPCKPCDSHVYQNPEFYAAYVSKTIKNVKNCQYGISMFKSLMFVELFTLRLCINRVNSN